MFPTLSQEERRSLFDQRYRMETMIGAGGGGKVWRAIDTDTNLPVAVKQIQVFSTAHRARVRREIGALRLLQIPGVVKLVDVGEVYSEPYIVMELLTGAPFPGRVEAENWPIIVRRALALCETLDRVHTLGVVHRDLKPGNVIVEDNGRVVLLDFGLARGEDLANTVTEDGGIVGTLRYLAPEQLRGGVPEPRTDLYSLGVMLYEALGGRRQIDDISNLRVWAHGPPEEGRTTPLLDVPESLSDLVLRMMNVVITRRPASAREVAEGLAAVLGETLAPPVQVPFCGRAALVDALVAAAQERRAAAIWGPEGSGRTRVLSEVARRLTELGRPTVWLPAGERPFSSLEPLLGELPQGPGTLSAAHDRLVERLRGGLVVFADDFLKLDLWSRRAIERARSEGAVLAVADLPGAAQLEPLSEADLRPLFRGPDAFLHLVEDGASLLHVRTRGIASRVARELRTWAATGRMAWNTTGERPVLECARADLEELEAWPGIALYGLGGAVDVTLAPALAEVLAWVVVSGGVQLDPLTEAAAVPAWELDMELEELDSLGYVARLRDGRVEASIVPCFL
ncbi:hypothetical protein LBMAG42_44580 [Deltaproteobacteria bacterium]|nr:hypothetical protein LBMAG42_44580 [Deltaproteobacteria bacterium]